MKKIGLVAIISLLVAVSAFSQHVPQVEGVWLGLSRNSVFLLILDSDKRYTHSIYNNLIPPDASATDRGIWTLWSGNIADLPLTLFAVVLKSQITQSESVLFVDPRTDELCDFALNVCYKRHDGFRMIQ